MVGERAQGVTNTGITPTSIDLDAGEGGQVKDRAAKIATYFWESHGNLIDTKWKASLRRAIRQVIRQAVKAECGHALTRAKEAK